MSQSETADIQLKMQDFRLQLLDLIAKVGRYFKRLEGQELREIAGQRLEVEM